MTERRNILRAGLLAAGASTVVIGTAATAAPALAAHRKPLIIGHRGACGYRPEHTLASYELAARMGADFIEPDLVTTKDHVLICRHEPEISATTDVASRTEFAGRRTTKTIDGTATTGWFTEDFTLAEIKTLRAVERIPATRQENTVFNGLFEVPALEEVLRLRERLSRELGRVIGVYPETKHPTYFQSIGLPLEPPLVAILRRYDLDRRNAPVFVQSFEDGNLRTLHSTYRLKAPLVFLAGGPTPLITPDGLRDLATFASGLGPTKDLIIPRRADGSLGQQTTLVADAHAAGLVVHPWTFRAENSFLPADLRVGTDLNAWGKIIDEIKIFIGTGIDGLFTDQTDVGIVARGLS
jgi:glycerophosphoryl diester phosphodiesterase